MLSLSFEQRGLELLGTLAGAVMGENAALRGGSDGACRPLQRFEHGGRIVGEDDLFTRREDLSIPGQRSEMIGVAQAAASNSRTDGDQPAAIMSARVTFSVNREAE